MISTFRLLPTSCLTPEDPDQKNKIGKINLLSNMSINKIDAMAKVTEFRSSGKYSEHLLR